MSHLNPEELARLVDEPPTAVEAGHLAACSDCAAELDAMRAEHHALAALPRILPVPTSWDTMRHRLEREGLLSGATHRPTTWMPSIAAAILLFLAGGATGAAVAGDWSGRHVVAVSEPSPVTGPSGAAGRTSADLRADPTPEHVVETDDESSDAYEAPPLKLAAREAPARSDEGVRLTADGGEGLPSIHGLPSASPNWDAISRRASGARTADEAARFVRDAEGAYLAAMTRLAELTEAGSSNPAVRLATLDGIVVTTGAALQRAPADPVINGYHLAARAQRDALLRTVSSSPEQDPWY